MIAQWQKKITNKGRFIVTKGAETVVVVELIASVSTQLRLTHAGFPIRIERSHAQPGQKYSSNWITE
jgi:hypothetical protein